MHSFLTIYSPNPRHHIESIGLLVRSHERCTARGCPQWKASSIGWRGSDHGQTPVRSPIKHLVKARTDGAEALHAATKLERKSAASAVAVHPAAEGGIDNCCIRTTSGHSHLLLKSQQLTRTTAASTTGGGYCEIPEVLATDLPGNTRTDATGYQNLGATKSEIDQKSCATKFCLSPK